MARILIIYPDAATLWDIRQFLEVECGRSSNAGTGAAQGAPENPDIQTDGVTNMEAAKQRLQNGQYDIVLSSLHVAASALAPMNEENDLGLALAQDLANAESSTILILPGYSSPIKMQVRQLGNCHDVVDEGMLLEEIEAEVVDILKQPQIPVDASVTDEAVPIEMENTGYLKIEINSQDNFIKFSTWTDDPDAIDDGPPVECALPPPVLQAVIKEWILLSDTLKTWQLKEDYKNWRPIFAQIGEHFRQLMRNTKLLDPWTKLAQEVGGYNNVRIVFAVNREIFDIPVEAIADVAMEPISDVFDVPEPSLQFPIIRGIDTKFTSIGKPRFPLFLATGRKTSAINCLIIDATVSGPAIVPPPLSGGREIELTLEKMKKGKEECNQIEKLLRKYVAPSRRGDEEGIVRRIPNSNSDDDFRTQVIKACKSGIRWDLVHFCGHSDIFIQKGKTAAYFFLPEPDDSKFAARGMNLIRFGGMLQNTRFLYLSSCHSIDKGLTYEMARQHMPAILGFQWVVNDNSAFQFARNFYQYLFNRENTGDIVSAFSLSRRDQLDRRDRDDDSAPSAVLCVQNLSKFVCHGSALRDSA